MAHSRAEPVAALSGQISLKSNKKECEETWYPAKSGFWNFEIDDILKVWVKHPECVFRICKPFQVNGHEGKSKVNFSQ